MLVSFSWKIIIVFATFSSVIFPALATAHEALEEDTVVIHMYDDRYEPENITVEAGTTIVFENVGEEEHWPASNIHPTHTLYPGSDINKCATEEEFEIFDACRGLKPGETYSFTFNRAGTWRYHDHIWPNLNGSITVIGLLDSAESLVTGEERETLTIKKFIESIKIALTKLYLKLSPSQAEKMLSDLDLKEVGVDDEALRYWMKIFSPKDMMLELLLDTDGGTTVDCHTQAHHLGRIAFELNGAEVFAEGDASCHSGFYHGAMETFLQQRGTGNLALDIKDICESFSTSFGVFECLHGVGHGLMAYEDYDLLQALADCRLLSDDFSSRSCYGGVFMENVVAGQGSGSLIGHETEWVSDDPHFPCNALEKDDYMVRFECYQMQTSWMLTLFNYDFQKVSEECLLSPFDMVSVCFKSLGRDISGNSLRDPDTIVSRCTSVARDPNLHRECIYGALNVIVDFWGEKLESQATEVCKLLVEYEKKLSCYELLASRLDNIFNDPVDYQRICSSFEPGFQNFCSSSS